MGYNHVNRVLWPYFFLDMALYITYNNNIVNIK